MTEGFSERLKRLRTERGLRQVELAKALGLAQTTIANYESGTRFPDEATLNRLADFLQSSMDHLLGRAEAPQGPAAAEAAPSPSALTGLAAKYLELLRSGERRAAQALVLSNPQRGRGVKALYAEILEPVLEEVGRLWEAGSLSVGEEHFISEATLEVMDRLPKKPGRTPAPGRTCCAFVPYGEQHCIGLRMIVDILEQDGWNVAFLGGNLPADHAAAFVKEASPALLALSVTMAHNLRFARDVITSMRSQEALSGVKIMTGGQAFRQDPKLWREVGADETAKGLDDVCRVARRLVPMRVGRGVAPLGGTPRRHASD